MEAFLERRNGHCEPKNLTAWNNEENERSAEAGCTKTHRGNARKTFTFSDIAISITIEKRTVTRLVVVTIVPPIQTSNLRVVHLSLT